MLSSPISQMAKLRSGEEAAAEGGSLLSCLCRGGFQYLATDSCRFAAGPEAPAVPGTSHLPTGSQKLGAGYQVQVWGDRRAFISQGRSHVPAGVCYLQLGPAHSIQDSWVASNRNHLWLI